MSPRRAAPSAAADGTALPLLPQLRGRKESSERSAELLREDKVLDEKLGFTGQNVYEQVNLATPSLLSFIIYHLGASPCSFDLSPLSFDTPSLSVPLPKQGGVRGESWRAGEGLEG